MIFCAVIISISVWFFSHSYLRSEASIRASLLKLTPIGTNATEVRLFVKKQGWLVPNYIGNTGFLKQVSGLPSEVVGVTSIQGNLDDFLNRNVTAYWGFDSSGNLIDIWVWKTYDAP